MWEKLAKMLLHVFFKTKERNQLKNKSILASPLKI